MPLQGRSKKVRVIGSSKKIAGSKINKRLSARTLGRRGITRLRYFLCQARVSAAMLLIVKGWFKRVKEKTWSKSGSCLVCK